MNLPSHIKLVVFDVDGTCVETRSGATFRTKTDERSAEADWQWIPGRLEALKELQRAKILIAVATNQGGVAFGYMQESDILSELKRMAEEAHLDALSCCCSHPHASIERYRKEDNRRKPGPGMLLDIMQELHIEPDNTLFVGDRPEDEQAAYNCGCGFQWAEEFFS